MEWASSGSHGRMRILERESPSAPTPPPTTAPRTQALARPFEARLSIDGTQFAVRAEPVSGSQQYRLRVWIGTPEGQWRLLEGLHNDRTWDALGEPLSIGLATIASSMGYRV